MSGTINMHDDNISKLNIMPKLDECANTQRSSAFDENDVMSMINTYKDHLQKSHDVVNINFPKENSETKEIINAMKKLTR